MVVGLGLLLSIGLASPVSAVPTGVVELEPPPDGGFIWVAAVNNNGDVFGNAGAHAVKWDRTGRVTVLGSLGGIQSQVFDANNVGTAVGWESNATGGGTRAIRWDRHGRAVELQGPPGARYVRASTITAMGDVLGMFSQEGLYDQAVRWDPAGRPTVLELPIGFSYTGALSISASGTVTGYGGAINRALSALRWDRRGRLTEIGPVGLSINDVDSRGVAVGSYGEWPDYRPVRWNRSGHVHELGRLTDAPAYPAMVNDRGMVAGHYPSGPADSLPLRWDPAGRPTALGLLPRFHNGYPIGINERGEIVGTLYRDTGGGNYTSIAVRWDRSGQAAELPPPPDTSFHSVAAINDRGEVGGTVLTADGQHRAVLWLADPHR